MRTTKRTVIVATALAAGGVPVAAARAQYFAGIGYSMGAAAGETRDFTESDSWAGFTFEGRRAIKAPFVAGLVLGSNVFTRNDPLVTTTGPVPGPEYHRLYYTTVLAVADWFVGDRDTKVRPFGGFGIGAYWIDQRVDRNNVSSEISNWHLGLAPEAGMAIRLTPKAYASIIGRYNYPVRGGNYLDGESHSYPFFSLGVGAAVLTF